MMAVGIFMVVFAAFVARDEFLEFLTPNFLRSEVSEPRSKSAKRALWALVAVVIGVILTAWGFYRDYWPQAEE
ncbi:MAG: hypothetical protein H8E15_08150 [Planctomycetes bacterium]|nr:hypothetical protein [Planctomycetota bacterium]